MYSKLSIRKSECFDNGLQASQTEVGGQDEGRELPFNIGLSGDQKVQGHGAEDVLSRMPPSEGLRMLMSTPMTGHDDGNHADGPFGMATWEVSRAHFYGEARRWVYTCLPEGHEQKGKWARLCSSMYGTRDAASIWRDTWAEVLKDCSMKVGTACPAFFCSHDGALRSLCHGDDFGEVARRKQLQTFGKILQKRFEVKQTGHIGFSASNAKELKILNRAIKIDALNDEMTLEADTKLVEDVLETMKLIGAKGVDSPRVRQNEEQTIQIESSKNLTSVESTLYRSSVMKLAYVAQDRIDIAEAVTCLTRHMKEPRSAIMQELKRLGRYLVKKRQTSEATLQVHVDSDWASDLLGRRSTTGVIVRRCKNLLSHMSCLQTLAALSNGEAEYYALIRGACTSLVIESHHQDWMIDVPIKIYSDSSAARSVVRRRGIGGRLTHLQTRHLWLQCRIALGHLKLDVVAGEQNPADILTKPLPGRMIREWSAYVGQRWISS